MNNSEFIPNYDLKENSDHQGIVAWKSPSNLAIVKYWGKHGVQLPQNPSISITLSEAATTTSVQFEVSTERKSLDLEFFFEDKEQPAFKTRIAHFLDSIKIYFPFIDHSKLTIRSSNSFPHSSGIASSASSMSALALCLCDIEKSLNANSISKDLFFKKSSFIARLGSGSACRSVYPKFGLWGDVSDGVSSNLYAVPVNEFHSVFNELRNDILIVSEAEKSVSSTAGHKLMEGNPYAQNRFDQALRRTHTLKSILQKGDISAFGDLLESEALTLHALMMASDPSYILMEPRTIEVINAIRVFRKEKNIPIYFSLDAGPNVHIISFEKDRPAVVPFLDELKPLAVGGKILNDKIGMGAKKIEVK